MPKDDAQSWRYLQALGDTAGAADEFNDLQPVLAQVVEQFGFSWFALVEATDLRRRDGVPKNVTNYPTAWQEEIIERALLLDDPAHAASAASIPGVRWDEISKYVVLQDRQRHTLQRARSHGLHSGFTMHLRAPRAPSLVFSVALDQPRELRPRDLLSARMIGAIIHEHAARLLQGSLPPSERIALSPRQVDCIVLVAQGKTDWEIATILGISRNTVHEYIEAIRKRYDVQKRIQIVLRAIQDGYIDYDALTA